MSSSASLCANWIWRQQDSYQPYHQVILARKTFFLEQSVRSARLCIAVDGAYRLTVNGVWVSDGPARSWPDHFQYDVIDLTTCLTTGENRIEIIARHWQTGDFHTRPQQAGLLVQIDYETTHGSNRQILSDEHWETAWLPAWAQNTPKVSIQMEPQEWYDARLEEDQLTFTPAAVLYPADGGPWQDLHPRDVALLNRKPLQFRAFHAATLVKHPTDLAFCLPAVRLAHPGVVEANRFVSAARGMATWIEVTQPVEVQIALDEMIAAIDGRPVENEAQRFALTPGKHFLLAFTSPLFGHIKERSLRILQPAQSVRLINPLDETFPDPWCDIALPAYQYQSDDMIWDWFDDESRQRNALQQQYQAQTQHWLQTIQNVQALQAAAEFQLRNIAVENHFVLDSHWAFMNRHPLGSAEAWVQAPAALIYDQAAATTVLPSPQGDIELCYDLGEQSVGYFELECSADAGVELDLYAVEYIASDGRIQHTLNNRNGLRYITRAGRNHFISLKRRAGRYLFITLRNQNTPVHFRLVRMIESTYPVEAHAFFTCSDPRLERIWDISARTLKLCMEDTFTDCPLYEQTHWVGDARNEALFAFDTFGATDIALRCLRLTAQSLERYPIAGAQVPSGWDTLLPAWSFLWGIAVWDYYFYTGDRAALEELWPAVLQNIRGAEQMLNAQDLFSGKFWNMFDWTGVDDHHEVVLHNTLLMIGAVAAAEKMSQALNDAVQTAWLQALQSRLVAAVERCWDADRQAYPDSIHEDGLPSASICQHTSFLALLYDAAPDSRISALIKNMLHPTADMIQVGSPFAILYLYEALDKVGQSQAILDSIYTNYLPMIEADASTVWEVFPSSGDRPEGFPTRSHTHAWSAAPLHFLPRTILGIHPAQVGGAAYEISPWIAGLDWARGQISTAKGPLTVHWRREAQRLNLFVYANAEIDIHFISNASIDGLEVAYSRIFE